MKFFVLVILVIATLIILPVILIGEILTKIWELWEEYILEPLKEILEEDQREETTKEYILKKL